MARESELHQRNRELERRPLSKGFPLYMPPRYCIFVPFGISEPYPQHLKDPAIAKRTDAMRSSGEIQLSRRFRKEISAWIWVQW
jgi:hypothetical protein